MHIQKNKIKILFRNKLHEVKLINFDSKRIIILYKNGWIFKYGLESRVKHMINESTIIDYPNLNDHVLFIGFSDISSDDLLLIMQYENNTK